MKSIQNTMRIIFGMIIVMMLVIFMSVLSDFERIFSLFFIIPILFISVTIVWTVLSKRLSTLYRESVIRVALDETFDDYTYDPKQGIDKAVVYDTQLFPKGNTYNSSDSVRVRIKGAVIEFADVSIQDVTSDDNGTHTTTYFQGKWVIMKSKKPIESRLYIIDRDNRLSKPKGWLFKGKELEKVEMESIQFNRMFNVYSTQPHDAFYVLTPPVIEGIMELDNHNLSVYQMKDVTHVAASGSKPLLNISIFSKLDEVQERNRVKAQFKTILEFVDFYGKESEGDA